MAFGDFIRAAPKAELHVHLRGAMPRKLFADLLRRRSPEVALAKAPPRQLELFRQWDNIRPFLRSRPRLANRVDSLFRTHCFDQFLATYLFTAYFVADISRFRDLVSAVVRDMESQNIVYAEITVSVVEYLQQGIALEDLLAALEAAAEESRMRVQWIVDLVRNIGPEAALSLLGDILRIRPSSVVGITLGGSERLFPPAEFVEVYRTARDHGLRRSVHAGEGLGPDSVWDALRLLQAERIGHGVRAIEDKRLVDYLGEHRIPLEVCPTSNLQTGIYPSYDAHPVKALYEAGVPVTINTDDPAFFSTTLAEEFEHVARRGCSDQDLLEMLKNGFRYAFLPPQEIESYLEEIDREWAEHQAGASTGGD